MKNKVKWSIDQAHSDITFKVKHMMIAFVKGSFKIFDASIYTHEKDFTTAEIDLWIESTSISTGDEKRDDHLKGADFFDVKNHKQITFTSRSIGKPGENGKRELWGELSIKGVKKNIKLDVEFGGIAKDPNGIEKPDLLLTG